MRTSCWRRKPALTASFRGRAQAEAKARSWAGHVSDDVQTLIFRVVLIEMPKRFVPWNCKGISGLRRWCVLHPLCSKVDAIRSHRYRSRRAHARSFSCCRCNCWWSSCEHHFRRRAEGDAGLRRWYATVSCAAENGRARCTDLGVAFGTDLIATGIRA